MNTKLSEVADEAFDFIVVGGGSAGCVVAARLAGVGKYRVLLLEAGRKSYNPWISIPVGTPKLFADPRLIWNYESDPEPGLNGRRVFQPRGKLPGGTGAINGMAYVRGNRQDFDRWREDGNVGWGYDDVLPFFRMGEDNANGDCHYHGVGGEMHVANQSLHRTIGDAFVVAAQQAGYTQNEDFNGPIQDGVGHFQFNYRNGLRINPADVFLHRRHKAYLTTRRGAVVDTIGFDDHHADHVNYSCDGRQCRARARREIIVCAGSFNSPQILQRSGIGPAEHLSRLEIPIVIDLPGVGENYQDHFAVQVSYESWLADTLNDDIASMASKLRMGLNYLFRRSGPMAHTGTYAGGFVRSHPDLAQPDLELNCNLWTRKYARTGGGLLDGFSGFTLLPMFLCPDARGSVRLTSRDPNEPPAIVSNSFQRSRDRQTMVRAVKLLRDIARRPALCRYVKREISPGPAIQSDTDIEKYVAETGWLLTKPPA